MRWRCSSAGSLRRAANSCTARRGSLLEETIDADLEAIAVGARGAEIARRGRQRRRSKPKRSPLPAHLPRVEVRHEPEQTVCGCGCAMKRIGEDVSEKLDYTPGVFHVERHIRGKWACAQVPDAGPGAGAGAGDRQGHADRRAAGAGAGGEVRRSPAAVSTGRRSSSAPGVAIPRSTLAQWVGACGVQLQPLVDALRAVLLERSVLHADETPVAMLTPGKGKTHRAYIWSYSSTAIRCACTRSFTTSPTAAPRRTPRHSSQGWSGKLVCDDYAGYKGLFAAGVTEVGCLAHARRKFHDLWVNHKSPLGRGSAEAVRCSSTMSSARRGN